LKQQTFSLLISLVLGVSMNSLTAQNNCMEIPDIGGGTCTACAPPGWDIWLLTPDVVNGTNWVACALSGVGTSPSGGNMIILDGSPTNVEGVSVEVTGLTPGTVYNIGFYWTEAYAQCGLLGYGGGDLLMIIDGFEYSFSGADDWELAEICYGATSTSVEIFLTIESDDAGLIVIDSGICEEFETCCDLVVEADNSYDICPGESIQLDAEFSEETGTVSVEWTCQPDDGLDFLDDRFALNPIFEVPLNGEFDGERYIFTLSVTDDVCTREEEVIIDVTPYIIPEFEIRICDLFDDFLLPEVSDDGYTGSWSGDFDFGSLGGTIQEYIFTLDPEQDNCLESQSYFVEIEASGPTTFDLKEAFCQLDPKEYDLPLNSLEAYGGLWEITFISPENLTPDFYTFYFFPDLDIHCALPFEYNFEIRNPDSLTFNIPTSFCVQQDNFGLPSASLEGIQGRWDEDSIYTDIAGVVRSVVFTPEEIEDCYFEYEHTYEITDKLEVSFPIADTLCRRTGYYELDTLSNEGYSGTWDPPAFSLDTISSDVVHSVWTPNPGQSVCLSETETTIQLNPIVETIIELPERYCQNSGAFVLPDISSLNAIPGNWDDNLIETDSLAPGTYIRNFIPDKAYCYSDYFYSFEIVAEQTPSFNLITGLCKSQPAITLPLISNEGFTGQWSIPEIDPSVIPTNTITSIFTTDLKDSLCLLDYEEEFVLDEKIDPTFSLDSILCSENGNIEFPTTADNGIAGEWSIRVIDWQDTTTQQINNNFMPNDTACYNPIELQFELIRLDLLTITKQDLSDCYADDGRILISGGNSDFEYSIDDGLSWTNINSFNGLLTGDYIVMARSTLDTLCRIEESVQITQSDLPILDSLAFNGPDNCEDENGFISIFAQGVNLEYSIDNGQQWSSLPKFGLLPDADYTILVRNRDFPSCLIDTAIVLNPFPETIIDSITYSNISDCDLSDAQIEIFAQGVNLEYSIDNGLSWIDDSLFDNLSPGTYPIVCRSKSANNCIEEQVILIDDLEYPSIITEVHSDPTDCMANDGTISIEANGNDLEFRISNAPSWQDSEQFTNLTSGSYTLYVREKDYKSCMDSIQVELSDPNLPVVQDIIITEPLNCYPDSGRLELITDSNQDYLFSLDGGMNYQVSEVFQNLSAGNYDIAVIVENSPNCELIVNVGITEQFEDLDLSNFVLTQPIDCISSDGRVEIQTDIIGLEFSIDQGISWQAEPSFDMLSQGFYSIQARKQGAPNCEDQIDFEIKNPPCPCTELEIDISRTDVSCESENSGSITIENISGLFIPGAYDISWNTGDSGEAITNLISGWYVYTINYDKNCSQVDSVFINDFDPIQFALQSFDKTCTEGGQIIVSELEGGNGEFSFSLDNINFQEESVFFNLSPDEYLVYVLDQFDCMEEDAITLNSSFDLSLELPGIEALLINESSYLNPLINPVSIDSFEWMPMTGILNPGELVAEVSPRETTEYTLTIYYGECVETRTVVVEVIDNRGIYLGNIFSPNGDKVNDVFYIQSPTDLDVAINSFRIFDRWGNLVFEKNNPAVNSTSGGWDGYFKQRPVLHGVYVYTIDYTLRGERLNLVGQVNLIR